MDQFLPLGHGTLDTTQPSIRFEGFEKPVPFGRLSLTFVDWVLENGVTEPRLRVEKFNALPGTEVSDRRLLSDRFIAAGVWMSTHRSVRPIDLVVAALLFLVIAFAAAQLLTPGPPTLPPLR